MFPADDRQGSGECLMYIPVSRWCRVSGVIEGLIRTMMTLVLIHVRRYMQFVFLSVLGFQSSRFHEVHPSSIQRGRFHEVHPSSIQRGRFHEVHPSPTQEAGARFLHPT
ncbi:hypothetical protein BaRGS_00020354 [Batillaria attramentaria]|uniref:Uncharacterized protein n=1 Tax=Batillaria attramentaria TaxID=370345 RepID=A0ABD0KNB4_9CAEN